MIPEFKQLFFFVRHLFSKLWLYARNREMIQNILILVTIELVYKALEHVEFRGFNSAP